METNKKVVEILNDLIRINNDRIEEVCIVIACGINPRHLQLAHIGLVDLVKRDEVGRIRPTAVIGPLLTVLLGGP